MFGYNRVPGLMGDGSIPAGIVVDGGIVAAGGVFAIHSDGHLTFIGSAEFVYADTVTQYADDVVWVRKDGTAVITQVDDGSIRLWHGLDSKAKITSTAGIGLFGHDAPSSAPTINGSRAAMGECTYQVIQALAATGVIDDGTTA